MESLPPELLFEIGARLPDRARGPFFWVCLLRLGTRVRPRVVSRGTE